MSQRAGPVHPLPAASIPRSHQISVSAGNFPLFRCIKLVGIGLSRERAWRATSGGIVGSLSPVHPWDARAPVGAQTVTPPAPGKGLAGTGEKRGSQPATFAISTDGRLGLTGDEAGLRG